MKKEIKKLKWVDRFDKKFENEVFPAVAIQLKKFISEVRIEAMSEGFDKLRKEMKK